MGPNRVAVTECGEYVKNASAAVVKARNAYALHNLSGASSMELLTARQEINKAHAALDAAFFHLGVYARNLPAEQPVESR